MLPQFLQTMESKESAPGAWNMRATPPVDDGGDIAEVAGISIMSTFQSISLHRGQLSPLTPRAFSCAIAFRILISVGKGIFEGNPNPAIAPPPSADMSSRPPYHECKATSNEKARDPARVRTYRRACELTPYAASQSRYPCGRKKRVAHGYAYFAFLRGFSFRVRGENHRKRGSNLGRPAEESVG